MTAEGKENRVKKHIVEFALVGVFAATWFYRWNNWRFWAVAVAVSLASWLVVRLLPKGKRRPNKMEREFEQLETRVRQLSLPEAKRQFEQMLTRPECYRCESAAPSDREAKVMESLPESAASLFSEYSLIEQIHGDLRLERSRIGPSSFGREFVVCGRTPDTEIVVKSGEESCYELDGIEPREDLQDSYPSLFHFLLLNAWIVYPDL